jgi:hypothetical protein
MGLYLKQNETRSELQNKLAAELQERARKKSTELTDRPDGVSDAEYMKNTKQTTSLAWVWLLISLAIVAIVIWLVIASTS